MIQEIELMSGGVHLRGRVCYPGLDDGAAPIVVILTGDSPKGVASATWPRVVETLNDAGIGVFLFDYCGQGASDGDRSMLSLSTASENFMDVMRFIGSADELAQRRIGVLGSSLGGAVFLNCFDHVQPIECVAFKSPASFLLEAYETEHSGTDAMYEWARDGISKITGLSYEAYLDAARYNLYAKVNQLRCPVLIVHGTADTVVPIAQSHRLARLVGSSTQLREIPGANHDYKEEGAFESFLSSISTFFTGALVA